MSTQEPSDKLRSEIDSIRYSFDALQSKARLADLRDAVEDLQTRVSLLPQRVGDLRSRGYPFEKQLEKKATDLGQQWAMLRPSISSQIDMQAMVLQQALTPIEHQFQQLLTRVGDPGAGLPLANQLRAAISTLESRVNAASSSIKGMYDSLQSEMDKLAHALDEVDNMLKNLAEASFRLLPSEAGIMTVKATLVEGGKEDSGDPQGVLFLTDQRLLFEQKQEIATKKVLFVTTEKKKVQELRLEVPIGLIETVTASKRGLFGHEDHLDLTFATGAPVDTVHFHIDGQDCNRWQALLGRAQSHDFDQDRIVPVDQVQVEKARSAPTVCPRCGAPITTTVVRGMDSIKCAYCGNVIRL